MFIQSLVLDNFRCFGPGRTTICLDEGLTAFIGTNGSGKTAACEALLRLFGVTGQERALRLDDFHVPADETVRPATRDLMIEVVLAFPELGHDEADDNADHGDGEIDGASGATELEHLGAKHRAIPDFFERMAATEDGDLKVRIVLKAEWVDDGTTEGAISEARMIVSTLVEEYGEEDFAVLPPRRAQPHSNDLRPGVTRWCTAGDQLPAESAVARCAMVGRAARLG
ncbi:AAA family ATPase [Saccharothrix sp. Mg75]|uniref:AAA family ATPase n=1 Tax=Saccharothrix sp. Mg75 TaxID=3445357 RepID=UPI003EE9A7F8